MPIIHEWPCKKMEFHGDVDPWLIKGTVIEDILFSEEYRNAVNKNEYFLEKSSISTDAWTASYPLEI
jgi:hypothetical protein